MAKITLELTEDHLKLIRNIFYQDFDDDKCGIDKNNLYGGNFILEDVAISIGRYNEMIPGSQDDYDGPKFTDELSEYMWNLHVYISENLHFIESLVHQFVVQGGITPGKYTCIDYEGIWKRGE